MLNSISIRTRLLVSIGSTGLRGLSGFFVIILIARSLSPGEYGSLMFLIGSFASIRGLMDLGSSSAFYTLISRQSRSIKFFIAYFLWLSLQFLITLILIAILIPESLFHQIWLGHSRAVVVTCFLAVFFQQQLMPQMSQIGESIRKSIKVQVVLLILTVCYMLTFIMLYSNQLLTQNIVLLLMIFQGVIGSIAILAIIKKDLLECSVNQTIPTYEEIFSEYWKYCRPLVVLSLITFAYDFADKWLLQLFGGAEQQGFFQIANQFSNAVLLVTTSIVNIFWKEIAEAWRKDERHRIESLYRRANRGLVFFGVLVCCMALPWTELIITTFVGEKYSESWPVLAIMLIYPIHIPMGVIGGATLLAVGETSKHMMICAIGMLLSMPVAYLMLASHSHGGLALGAVGLAIKLVLFNVVTVNIQSAVIAKIVGWKWDWKFQVVGITLMLINGLLAKEITSLVWGPMEGGLHQLAPPLLIASSLYMVGAALIVWFQPWLLGISRDELHRMVALIRWRNA